MQRARKGLESRCAAQHTNATPTSAAAIDLVARGSSPEILPLNGADRMARHKAYVGSIVGRDVAPVAEIRRLDTLRRLINLPGPSGHQLAQGEPEEDRQPNHQQNYLSQRHVTRLRLTSVRALMAAASVGL